MPYSNNSEAALDPVFNYLRTLRDVLFHPTSFFRKQNASESITRALIFALVTNWIGSALGFINHSLIWQQNALDIVVRLRDYSGIDTSEIESLHEFTPWAQSALVWFKSVGAVLLNPFYSLLSLAFVSFFIFIGARLLISPKPGAAWSEINYQSVFRLCCWSTAPAFFKIIPWVGSSVVWIYSFCLLVIGIRESFQISTQRATFVAVFPQLLLLIPLFLLALLMLLFVFFGLSLFGLTLSGA